MGGIESILPVWAVAVLALSVGMGVAGLGIWMAAQALESLVKLIRRTLAADLRLQHLKMGYDNATLNYWVRDAFAQKKMAIEARARANQEKSLREQIARGAEQQRLEA